MNQRINESTNQGINESMNQGIKKNIKDSGKNSRIRLTSEAVSHALKHGEESRIIDLIHEAAEGYYGNRYSSYNSTNINARNRKFIFTNSHDYFFITYVIDLIEERRLSHLRVGKYVINFLENLNETYFIDNPQFTETFEDKLVPEAYSIDFSVFGPETISILR